jgi:hypothetical protein
MKGDFHVRFRENLRVKLPWVTRLAPIIFMTSISMKKIILTISLGLIMTDGLCQKGPSRFFGEPILTDTLSTLFIPTRYNEEFLSSNKIAFWGDYYANIIVYDYKTDSYKKLFEKDTFIESFRNSSNNYGYGTRTNEKPENVTTKWVFLLVKTKDTNNSGRIDEKDPSILYAVSTNGENLKQLTDEKENVVSFSAFDKQGFILIKIQKDSDNDKSFKAEDKEFYFKKLGLTDLSLGKGIELK